MDIPSLMPPCLFLQIKRWSQQGDPGHHCLLQGEGEAGGVTRRVSVGHPRTVLHLLSNLGTGLCSMCTGGAPSSLKLPWD